MNACANNAFAKKPKYAEMKYTLLLNCSTLIWFASTPQGLLLFCTVLLTIVIDACDKTHIETL